MRVEDAYSTENKNLSLAVRSSSKGLYRHIFGMSDHSHHRLKKSNSRFMNLEPIIKKPKLFRLAASTSAFFIYRVEIARLVLIYVIEGLGR